MKVYSPSIIEGLIVSGSATISGSLFVEGTISASGLTGNIENALTASYVQLEDVDGFTDYSASVRNVFGNISESIDDLNNFTSSVETALTLDGGDVTIAGNLTVQGTQTTINTEVLSVESNVVELNTAGAIKGGILVGDITAPSQLSGSLLWDGTNDHWVAGVSGSEQRIILANEFNSYTSSTDERIGDAELELIDVRSTLNSYTSSADNRINDLENFSSSLDATFATDAELGSATSSIITAFNEYTSSTNAFVSNLEIESGSIRSDFSNYTSSTDERISDAELELIDVRSTLNSYTSSTDNRINDLENFSSSLDATFATDAELGSATSSIISTFNSYTSSADLRLGSLESESGSIRSALNNYTSSTDDRLSSIETESGSIRTDFSNYTSSADGRLSNLETESGSIRTAFNNFTGSSGVVSASAQFINLEDPFTGSFTGSFIGDGAGLTGIAASLAISGSAGNDTVDLKTDALTFQGANGVTTVVTDNTLTIAIPAGTISGSGQVDHNATTNYVSNQHIDHSTVDITAGSGLSGGGNITATRTLTLDTGSAHFTGGVKTKLDADLVVSGSDTQVKTFLSLNNVDNTADADKPLSTAQKAYVDEVAQGLKARTAARVLVDTDLNATYDNGVNGSGSFLESNTNGAFPTTDGIDSTELNVVGTRILVIGQTNKEENGLYVVQTVGDGSTPWKIRRCVECDSDEEIPGSFIFVKSGTVYANTGWILLVDNPATFTIGIDDINPTQFSGAGSFLAGDGLDLDGNTFSLDTGSVHFNTGVKNKLNTDLVVSSSAQIIAALPAGTISGSGQVDHNATTNYVANQHIDHSTVNISAGSGLTGGGNITATRTLTLDTGSAHFTSGVKTKMNADGVISGSAQVAINSTTGTLNVNKGGTGQTTYTNGQLLIGNTTGNTLTKATLTAGTGISITNGAGSISIAATNNGTVTSIATGNGITGGTITSTGTLGLDGQALALHNLSTNGVIARTGAGTVAGRTITGTTNQVTVTNGDGVSGNPTLSLPQNIHTAATPTFGAITINGTIGARASTSATAATQFPVFNADPASTTRTIVTRTPAQVLSDIGAYAASNPSGYTTNTGTVTSIATNNGITGGTITTTGTVGLTGQALALHNLATNGVIARTGAGTVAGRTITASTGVTVTNGNGVSGNPTIAIGQAVATTSNVRFNSLGVNTNASGTAGEIRATNEITAFFSDARLKNFYGTIQNSLSKVLSLNGYYFTENEVAKSLGYNNDKMQVGLSAQEVQAVLPEVVTEAPISDEYLTVRYEKLIPLLVEAIKEQQQQIEELKAKLDNK